MRADARAHSRSRSDHSYPRWQYGCTSRRTYSDDEEEYGAYLSAQYHAGWV